jgi:hypothetical protein
MRIDALDDLAIQLKDETQHAVRSRMLRPEVDVEVAYFGFRHERVLRPRRASGEW